MNLRWALRKLLMHKEEIRKLVDKLEPKGTTLIPTKIYFRNGRAKCELALAHGKQDWDRRQEVRIKEARREVKEAIYESETALTLKYKPTNMNIT